MRRLLMVFALLGCASAAGAEPFASDDPFANGDPRIGKQMVDKNCISCHASSFGGNGSAIYTRENRIVKDAKGLQARIRTCNTNLGLKWFEDEEMHVAAYLNQAYYHFK